MKKDILELKLLVFGICSFLIVYFFIPARIFLPFNDFPNQYHNIAFPHVSSLPKIVAVAIDDYSLNKSPDRYPWPRSVYAKLLKNLDNEGVRVIGFDLVLKGASEDPSQEQLLAQALKSLKASVVLGYEFDYMQNSPGQISDQIDPASYTAGMLNTLQDEDGFLRKMLISYRVNDRVYYSFSAMFASAVLGKSPAEIVSTSTAVKNRRSQGNHTFEDTVFYINYRLKPYQRYNAVPIVSFYDVLHDMEKLKIEWGSDFLNGSVVLVFPAAEVRHDIHLTPMGKMPGGFVQLNGIMNIIQKTGVDSPGYIPVLFFLFSAGVLVFALRMDDFKTSLMAFTMVLALNFLAALLLWYFHIKADTFRVMAFAIIFYVSAGAYRSISFMARLSAIKDRATRDPLRGMYTVRYFRYRLELEARRNKVQLIMVHMADFKEQTQAISMDRLKTIWVHIHGALAKMSDYWSSYSLEEVVGFCIGSPARFEGALQSLRDDLEVICKGMDLKIVVKVCAVQFKKNASSIELFSALSRQVRSQTAGVLVTPDSAMQGQGLIGRPPDREQILDGLAEDIEEKNRQMLNLYEKLKNEHGKTKEAFYQIITSLVNALEARDPYTQGHSQRVANYALVLADRLGWTQDRKERLRKASLLHDLGKIGIPDSILHKKGQLTEEEFGFIKQHEVFAVNILKPLKEIEDILPWILYHHEKWDGTGYPHGLGGDAIPLESQIIALSDVFDALTTGRDYKIAISRSAALDIIQKGKGTHFNPDLADMFVAVIRSTNT